ncbi:hypothetical protein LZ32DRAFT_647663 [Colletotrichum eremochloae]|nr:hypothetical protein LZ32DRAFT_647663 [Colletotrichum eremochloae]
MVGVQVQTEYTTGQTSPEPASRPASRQRDGQAWCRRSHLVSILPTVMVETLEYSGSFVAAAKGSAVDTWQGARETRSEKARGGGGGGDDDQGTDAAAIDPASHAVSWRATDIRVGDTMVRVRTYKAFDWGQGKMRQGIGSAYSISSFLDDKAQPVNQSCVVLNSKPVSIRSGRHLEQAAPSGQLPPSPPSCR